MPKPIYSGPECCGVCVCGHKWDEHHLDMVMNLQYFQETGETYLPQECEHFGMNEMGGLDAEGNDHCHGYRDSMWPDEHN